jgi:hypothetical protein
MNMNRYLASGLGVALGLLASAGRADEVTWRAARDRTARPAPPAIPAEAIVTDVASAENGAATPILPVPDDAPPATGVLPPPTAPDTVPRVLPPPNGSSHLNVGDDSAWHAGGEHSACNSTVVHQAPRLEVTGEYLLWWSKRPNTGPPLLTTSPPNGANGVPGAVPGSTVLLSAGDLGSSFRDGARFGATYWLDDCASYGFDARIFFTGDRTDRFQATSDQFPNGLFRPFFIANPVVPGGPPVGEFREVVTAPGSTTGRFIAENSSRFWGAEVNYRDNLCCSCDCGSSLRTDLLVGFRYLNLDESLTMTEDVVRVAASTMFPDEVAGTHIVNSERFATSNNFYGGQIGTSVGYRRDRLTVDLRATVALGTTDERLNINGNQVRTIPGGQTLVLRGGLLALPTNSGESSRNVFSVVPEIGINVGYQVTDHVRAFVGYNYLYWSNVIRPGDQIDRVIDINNIPRFVNVPPGTIPAVFPPRPAVRFNDSDFWAQGATVGVEYRW